MSAEAGAVRIVVADDHQVVRAGFAGLLGTQPDFAVVGTVGDGPRRCGSATSCIPMWS